MNELNEIAKWLYGRLSSSAFITDFVGTHPTKLTPQIYEQKAPKECAFPYCVFFLVTSQTIKGAEGQKVFVRAVYNVIFRMEGYDFSGSELASNDVMSQLQSSQVDGVDDSDYVQGCVEVRPLMGSDSLDGANFMYIGTQVEVMCRAMG